MEKRQPRILSPQGQRNELNFGLNDIEEIEVMEVSDEEIIGLQKIGQDDMTNWNVRNVTEMLWTKCLEHGVEGEIEVIDVPGVIVMRILMDWTEEKNQGSNLH